MGESVVKSVRINAETWDRIEAYSESMRWSANKAMVALVEEGLLSVTPAESPAAGLPLGNIRPPMQKTPKKAKSAAKPSVNILDDD